MMDIVELRQKYGTEAALVVLLLRCHFNKATPEEVHRFLQEQTVDWDHFYNLLCAWEIRQLVYKTLSTGFSEVNLSLMEKLKGNVLFLATANLRRLQELLRLQHLFRLQGITVVPFKGGLLSQELFGDISLRETCDIDFLVQAHDSIAITEWLFAEGYTTDYYFDKAQEGHLLNISCERGFTKPDDLLGLLSVEIHWEVLLPSSDVPLRNKDLFNALQPVKVAGAEIDTLSQEDTLITLLAHHGVTDVWRTPKHVVDLAAFLVRHPAVPESEPFWQKLKKLRMRKTAITGMELAHALFGITLPNRCNEKKTVLPGTITNNLLGFPMLTKFKYAPAHLRQHLRLRDNNPDKLRLMGQWFFLLFLPTANDLRYIKLPQRLFFLYYFTKPFRLLNDHLLKKKRGGSVEETNK